MTNEKRELIKILLDNITPDDWPEHLPYAAQDKINGDVWAYSSFPEISGFFYGQYSSAGDDSKRIWKQGIICRNWDKTIVHRDEFIKRWDERNNTVTNTTTPPAQKESRTEETKPIQQEVKATDNKPTSIGRITWNGKFIFEDFIEAPIDVKYCDDFINQWNNSMKNGLDPLQHTIIKYVTRFRDKAGIEDLEKAKHCIDMLIEYEKENK